ncbi:hypothetical protein TNCV_2491971 [Trichonephila clavipes]|nr:hypothetical protein TNCV_2491971 [Trichonephila clavipes]
MTDKDILEFVQSSHKSIIEADSDDENAMNNAAPVPTSSEMKHVTKRGDQDTRPRKTSLREDRLLLSNRKLNSSQILKQWTLTSNVSVCPRTFRGRLLELGYEAVKRAQNHY